MSKREYSLKRILLLPEETFPNVFQFVKAEGLDRSNDLPDGFFWSSLLKNYDGKCAYIRIEEAVGRSWFFVLLAVPLVDSRHH